MREEFLHRNINFLTELKLPVVYKSKSIDINFRCNLFIEQCLVVALKSVSDIAQAFEAQFLTHMKLLKAPKGILINFNCNNIFKEGQKTYVNDLYKTLNP